MMTMMLLRTSDAECTASLIMAPELAAIPASSFRAERMAFPMMLTMETRTAVFAKGSYICFSITVTSKKQLQVTLWHLPPAGE